MLPTEANHRISFRCCLHLDYQSFPIPLDRFYQDDKLTLIFAHPLPNPTIFLVVRLAGLVVYEY